MGDVSDAPNRDKPEQTRDRDDRGLFTKGNKIGALGGRPRGFDFRAVLADVAKETQETPEQVAAEAVRRLRTLGAGTDAVALGALKLLIERTFEKDPDKLDVNFSALPAEERRRRLRLLVEEAFAEVDGEE